MFDTSLKGVYKEKKGWIKYIFPYGRISDFNTVWAGTTVVRLLQFFFHPECFFFSLTAACIAVNSWIFLALRYTFVLCHFAKPIQKNELCSNFHQDKFAAREASSNRNLNTHFSELGLNHPELKGPLCLEFQLLWTHLEFCPPTRDVRLLVDTIRPF